MSTPINDGGPAFPTQGEQFVNGPHGVTPASAYGMEGKPGMSLRAWFAGQVIAAIVDWDVAPRPGETYAQACARLAVFQADMLIAELERKES